jgi:prepilin peptidase CpaA
MIDILLVGLFVALLVAAVVYDVKSLRIPNWVCYLIAGLFGVKYLILGAADGLALHLLVFGCALTVGFVAFAFNVVGAGDAKLLSAICLWLGPTDIPMFILLMAVVGGLFGLLVIVARHFDYVLIWFIPYEKRRYVPDFLLGDGPIPYGVAITGGALLSLVFSHWNLVAVSMSVISL